VSGIALFSCSLSQQLFEGVSIIPEPPPLKKKKGEYRHREAK